MIVDHFRSNLPISRPQGLDQLLLISDFENSYGSRRNFQGCLGPTTPGAFCGRLAGQFIDTSPGRGFRVAIHFFRTFFAAFASVWWSLFFVRHD